MIAGLEALQNYNVFLRSQMIFKLSDIGKKTVGLNETWKPPKNSMLHTMSNLADTSKLVDGLDVEMYPFIKNTTSVKYVRHITDLKALDSTYLKFTKRIYTSGMLQVIVDTNAKFKRYAKPIRKITDQILDTESVYILTNFNPVFRVSPLNNKSIDLYNRHKFVFHNVILTLNQYPSKHHFLFVPLEKESWFNVSNLLAVASKSTVTNTMLRSSSNTYFSMLHLVTFLLNQGDTHSVFKHLTPEALRTTNLVFSYKGTAVIFNLYTMASMITSKAHVKRLLDFLFSITYKDQPSVLNRLSSMDLEDSSVEEDLVETVDEPGSPITQKDIDNKTVLHGEQPVAVSDKPYSKSSDQRPAHELIDTNTSEFIDNLSSEELTPAQRTRTRSIASKYKTIKVKQNGKELTIEELLSVKPQSDVKEVNYPVSTLLDKSMTSTTLPDFDKVYREQYFERDIITGLLSFQDKGLFLTDFKESDEVSSFNRVRHIVAKFEDPSGAKHTVKFKLPIPDDDGYFLVNGVKLSMKRQLVNVPISKVSPTRVSLVSNYNKALVEKLTSVTYDTPTVIKKQLSKLKGYEVNSHTKSFVDIDVPYEYVLIGSNIESIKTPTAEFSFDFDNRYEFFKIDEELEAEFGTVFGKLLGKRHLYFINKNNEVRLVDVQRKNVVETTNVYEAILQDNTKVPYEWCNLKILDKNLPIIFVLAYQFGLSATLSYLNVKYRSVESGKRVSLVSTELAIKFKDQTLIIDRYPLLQSLIVSGLKMFPDTKKFNMFEMDLEDTYYQLLDSRGMSRNYLIGIKNYFNFFIDPITYEVLQSMGEPTNTRDLLIRSVDMLISDTTKPASSISNYRTRSLEKFPSVMYNEIARQYANHQSSSFKSKAFSINTEAVYQRLIQDQSMGLKEEINPVQAAKETSAMTFTGFGGRTSESFVERDRKYPQDGMGIVSESTPDSGSVGLTVLMTGNPNIANMRGMFTISGDDDPTNILSDTSLLMPGVTNDDPKRCNFVGIQLSHHVPSDNSEMSRVVTGYEQMITHKTSSDFVVTAKDKGKIVDIDEQNSLLKVAYKDSTYVYEYGTRVGEVAGSFLEHNLVLDDSIKKGKIVKKADVLIYHKGFFMKHPLTNNVSWCHGIPARVLIAEKDYTREDSCLITQSFADKMKFNGVYIKPFSITSDMRAVTYKKPGDSIKYGDILVQFDFGEDISLLQDDEDSILDDIGFDTIKADRDGTILKVEVFSTTDVMTDSIKKFVKTVTKSAAQKQRFAKGSANEGTYVIQQVDVDTKIRGINVGDNELLIVYYISSNTSMSVGDKLVLDSSLKSVVADVSEEDLFTEDGSKIDMVFGGKSIFNRIILSPLRAGVLDSIIESVENEVLEEYFDT